MEGTQTRAEREQQLWKLAEKKYKISKTTEILSIDLINWNMLSVETKHQLMDKSWIFAISVFKCENKELIIEFELSDGFTAPEGVQGVKNTLIQEYGDEHQ